MGAFQDFGKMFPPPNQNPGKEKNAGSPGCMHPCCGPSFGPNDRKLVIKNDTLHKIWLAFWKAGISFEDANEVVQDMLTAGILFREEA